MSDLGLALRALRRSPTFTATAVLILGLGIGMAVAMFTVTDTVLLRPLPVHDQERIALPRIVDPRGIDLPLAPRDLEELRRDTRTMSVVAGEAHQGAFGTVLLDGDRPLVLKAAWVTGNFFDVLGARPALGRLFRTEDESLTEPSVLVLSYDTWQRRFGGDSGVLGRQLTQAFTGRRHTIVGVAPAGLAYPVGAEYWSPMVYGGGLDVVARLAPTATPAAARAEFFSTMTEMYRKQHSRNWEEVAGARIRTFSQAVLGDVRPVLQVLTAAVTLLLVLACVNVGSLVLLRVATRTHEVAVRRSLGATTGDVARLLLVETGALAIGGGSLGFVLAVALLRMLLVLEPAGLPRTDLVRLENAPLGAAVGVTLLAVLLVGVLPALAATHTNLASPLRIDAWSGSETKARKHVRRWFVAAQVALAIVVLAGAGLLARSLDRLLRIDLGYRADRLSLLWLAVPVSPNNGEARFTAMLDRILPALHALPEVTAITPVEAQPFFGPQVFNAQWEVEGSSSEAGEHPRIPIEAGGPEYFRTLEIPLFRGRGFLDSDGENAPKVAVVSEGAARLLQLGADPIGQRIRAAGDTGAGAWRTVVGIAGDIHFRSLREATPTIYLPSRQYFFQGLFAVRTIGPLAGLLPTMRRAVHDADPAVDIVRTETMEDLLANQRALPTLSTLLLSGFGLVAMLLAAVGLYGLMASVVREQTREIGVRMALGATPAQLRRGVLGAALGVTAVGAAVGLAAALVSSRFLTALLFQVSPADPITLAAVSVLLVAVGCGAAYVPARRAMKVDPMVALRYE